MCHVIDGIETVLISVGSEVPSPVVMKSSIFWNITPYGPSSQLTFRGNISHPSSRLKSEPNKQPACCLFHGFSLGLLFNPKNAGYMCLRNVGRLYRAHGVISQKTELQNRKHCWRIAYRRWISVTEPTQHDTVV
jgi:hypothetical protein